MVNQKGEQYWWESLPPVTIDPRVPGIARGKVVPLEQRRAERTVISAGFNSTNIVNDLNRNSKRKRIIYLASPYSSPVAELRQWRYEQALEALAIAARDGIYMFSPIVNSHNVVENYPEIVTGDWEFWEGFDKEMILRCAEVWVLQIDGWFESIGVDKELKFAYDNGVPVKYVSVGAYNATDSKRGFYIEKYGDPLRGN